MRTTTKPMKRPAELVVYARIMSGGGYASGRT
jgi:hypothetical protein